MDGAPRLLSDLLMEQASFWRWPAAWDLAKRSLRIGTYIYERTVMHNSAVEGNHQDSAIGPVTHIKNTSYSGSCCAAQAESSYLPARSTRFKAP